MQALALILTLSLGPIPVTSQAVSGSVAGAVVRAGTTQGLADARVTVMPAAGGKALEVRTDNQGRFVVESVPPGNARLTVQSDGHFASERIVFCPATGPLPPSVPVQGALQATATLCVAVVANGRTQADVSLVPGGTIRGRILDPNGGPAVNVGVQAVPVEGQGTAQTVQTNDRGEFRAYWVNPGRYLVGVTPRPPSAAPGPQDSYARTYFPGTIDAARALPVDVEPGMDLAGIDFSIQTTLMVTVSGRVVSTIPRPPTNGVVPPIAFSLYLIPREPTPLDSAYPSAALNSSPNRAQGEFVVRGVRPGPYDVIAAVTDAERRTHFGRSVITVGPVNAENVIITVSPNVSVSGRSVVSPTARVGAAWSAQTMRIELTPADPSPAMINLFRTALAPVVTDATGAFTIPSVPPGKYTVTPLLPYYVSDIRQNGASVYREGLTVADRPLDGIEVVLDEGARVTGSLRTAEQRPITDATVLWMPDSPRRDERSLFKTATTNAAGNFTISGIVPGEYKLTVWQGAVSSAVFADGRFLDRIEPLAVSVSATAGSVMTLQYVGKLREAAGLPETRMLEVVPADAAQASFEGRVWNGQQAAPGATVVLIRNETSQIRMVTSSATGYFVFRGSISGEYRLLAFASLPAGALQNPDFVAKYEQYGRAVSLNPAGSVSVQLNIIPK